MPTLKLDNTKLVDGGIEEQTHQVSNNLIDVLGFARSSIEKIILTLVHFGKFSRLDRINKAYSSYFK